jgi:hypothetical protein
MLVMSSWHSQAKSIRYCLQFYQNYCDRKVVYLFLKQKPASDYVRFLLLNVYFLKWTLMSGNTPRASWTNVTKIISSKVSDSGIYYFEINVEEFLQALVTMLKWVGWAELSAIFISQKIMCFHHFLFFFACTLNILRKAWGKYLISIFLSDVFTREDSFSSWAYYLIMTYLMTKILIIFFRKFSAQNYLKIRETRKYTQKTLNRVLDNMPALYLDLSSCRCVFLQYLGSGIDPNPDWIRIRIWSESGVYPDSVGAVGPFACTQEGKSRLYGMKIKKFRALKCWMFYLENWRLLPESFIEIFKSNF